MNYFRFCSHGALRSGSPLGSANINGNSQVNAPLVTSRTGAAFSRRSSCALRAWWLLRLASPGAPSRLSAPWGWRPSGQAPPEESIPSAIPSCRRPDWASPPEIGAFLILFGMDTPWSWNPLAPFGNGALFRRYPTGTLQTCALWSSPPPTPRSSFGPGAQWGWRLQGK